MDAAFVALVVIILVALAFDYTNGFHDAANAIAVAVSTKALTPRVALGLAAVMNLVGALLSTEVAKTVGAGIIDPPEGSGGLEIVFAGVIGAIVWNLITWWVRCCPPRSPRPSARGSSTRPRAAAAWRSSSPA